MKNIIITGCSSGFGWVMSKELAKEGHTVYATMRNITTSNRQAAEELTTWARENKLNIFITELDVTRPSSVTTAIKEIALNSGGNIDVLINNAGVATAGLVEEYSDQELHTIFETLVFGPDRMNKAVLPYMHQRNSGLLMLISSRMSAFQLPFAGVYSAAKAAIHAMTKNLSYELRHSGIDSVVVQAGSFETSIGQKSMQAQNTAVSKNYGDWYITAREKVFRMFTTYQQPQDIRLVTDLVSEVINTASGKRRTVYPVGLGALEPAINEINFQSESISKTLMEKIGV